MRRSDPVTRSLADDVLRYFVLHPRAQGSLEDIVEWWLLEQRLQDAMNDVKLALNTLLAKGFVIARQRRDGRIHYAVNPTRLSDIRAHLETGLGERRSRPGKRQSRDE